MREEMKSAGENPMNTKPSTNTNMEIEFNTCNNMEKSNPNNDKVNSNNNNDNDQMEIDEINTNTKDITTLNVSTNLQEKENQPQNSQVSFSSLSSSITNVNSTVSVSKTSVVFGKDWKCLCGEHVTVNVQSRTWPGINQPGGIGRITKYDAEKDRYNVKYILGGSEKNIEKQYIQCVTSLMSEKREVKPTTLFQESKQEGKEPSEDKIKSDNNVPVCENPKTNRERKQKMSNPEILNSTKSTKDNSKSHPMPMSLTKSKGKSADIKKNNNAYQDGGIKSNKNSTNDKIKVGKRQRQEESKQQGYTKTVNQSTRKEEKKNNGSKSLIDPNSKKVNNDKSIDEKKKKKHINKNRTDLDDDMVNSNNNKVQVLQHYKSSSKGSLIEKGKEKKSITKVNSNKIKKITTSENSNENLKTSTDLRRKSQSQVEVKDLKKLNKLKMKNIAMASTTGKDSKNKKTQDEGKTSSKFNLGVNKNLKVSIPNDKNVSLKEKNGQHSNSNFENQGITSMSIKSQLMSKNKNSPYNNKDMERMKEDESVENVQLHSNKATAINALNKTPLPFSSKSMKNQSLKKPNLPKKEPIITNSAYYKSSIVGTPASTLKNSSSSVGSNNGSSSVSSESPSARVWRQAMTEKLKEYILTEYQMMGLETFQVEHLHKKLTSSTVWGRSMSLLQLNKILDSLEQNNRIMKMSSGEYVLI